MMAHDATCTCAELKIWLPKRIRTQIQDLLLHVADLRNFLSKNFLSMGNTYKIKIILILLIIFIYLKTGIFILIFSWSRLYE